LGAMPLTGASMRNLLKIQRVGMLFLHLLLFTGWMLEQ
jgi:hypothetical protein